MSQKVVKLAFNLPKENMPSEGVNLAKQKKELHFYNRGHAPVPLILFLGPGPPHSRGPPSDLHDSCVRQRSWVLILGNPPSVRLECIVLQCVAVCCSVLQCVAVWCSVLQCGAVCCSVLQCVVVCCSVLQCVAVRCSALQCVAVCCRLCLAPVLQRVAVCCSSTPLMTLA